MKFLVVLSTFIVASLSEKLPPGFKRCSIKDKKCLFAAVQDAIPRFKDGFKEFGVPPLDPLFIPEMTLGGGKQVIQLNQVYKNVTLSGLATSKVTNFSIDMKDERIVVNTIADQLVIKGNHTANGRILVLPVKGSGPFSMIFDKAVGTFVVDFKTNVKKGKKYLRGTSANLIFDVSHAEFNFSNLFQKNRSVEDSIANVLNENWREIFDELVPSYTEGYAQALLQVVNRFFSKIPLSEIFYDLE